MAEPGKEMHVWCKIERHAREARAQPFEVGGKVLRRRVERADPPASPKKTGRRASAIARRPNNITRHINGSGRAQTDVRAQPRRRCAAYVSTRSEDTGRRTACTIHGTRQHHTDEARAAPGAADRLSDEQPCSHEAGLAIAMTREVQRRDGSQRSAQPGTPSASRASAGRSRSPTIFCVEW